MIMRSLILCGLPHEILSMDSETIKKITLGQASLLHEKIEKHMNDKIPVVDLNDTLVETAAKLDMLKKIPQRSSGVKYCLRCRDKQISANKVYCANCNEVVTKLREEHNKSVESV